MPRLRWTASGSGSRPPKACFEKRKKPLINQLFERFYPVTSLIQAQAFSPLGESKHERIGIWGFFDIPLCFSRKIQFVVLILSLLIVPPILSAFGTLLGRGSSDAGGRVFGFRPPLFYGCSIGAAGTALSQEMESSFGPGSASCSGEGAGRGTETMRRCSRLWTINRQSARPTPRERTEWRSCARTMAAFFAARKVEPES